VKYSCDPYIQCLIRRVEEAEKDSRPNPGIGIDLAVGGAFISGTLISEAEFGQRSHQQYEILGYATAHADEEIAIRANTTVSEVQRTCAPEMIHLGDVHFYGQHELAIGRAILWRGRLDRVDGFFVAEQRDL